jgi:coproporphyrinogen III oxidase-like Fe-S oxidoreductase
LRTTKPKQPREYQEHIRRAAAGVGPGAAAGPDAGAGTAPGEHSFILPADLPFEFMLNALRLNEGFRVDDYQLRTGLQMDSVEVKLAEGERRGLLTKQAGGWRPTELGRRFLNNLQASFLA